MSSVQSVTGPLRPADLPKSSPLDFALQVTPERTARIIAALGVRDLRKLRLTGRLRPTGRADWHLTARLGATVLQSCVATGAPVLTRIDTDLERLFVADWAAHVPDMAETEMPEDDRIDPLGEAIDLEALVTEALALALPDFPRSDEAAPVEVSARPAGTAPLEAAATRPFAALAELKRKLEDDS